MFNQVDICSCILVGLNLPQVQEAMLKEEVRNMERMQKRGGVDMTYLKNVILKLLETGRPVI